MPIRSEKFEEEIKEEVKEEERGEEGNGKAENLFEGICDTVEKKMGKGKEISLSFLDEKFEGLVALLEKEKNESLIRKIKDWSEDLRDKNPILYQGLFNILVDKFNGRWPGEFLKKEKAEERPGEISSEILWEEIVESSRHLDKVLGRSQAKKLRRKIKKGLSPEEIAEKEETLFKEKEVDPSQVKELLEDYEAHYKSWRSYIEEEAEKELEVKKTEQCLQQMWEKGEISIGGLEDLAHQDPTVEKLGSVMLGDFYEKYAARNLLEKIRRGEVLSEEVKREVRNSPAYQKNKKKFEERKLSLNVLEEIAKKQKENPKLPKTERWAQALYQDMKREIRKRKRQRRKEREKETL